MTDSSTHMARSAQMFTLLTLRTARKRFHDNLCLETAKTGTLHQKMLRGDGVFAMSEFLYLLSNLDLLSHPRRLATYLHSHTAKIDELIADPERRRILGLDVPRLKRGRFTDLQVAKTLANLAAHPPGLDQSDIQRLSILLFSPETCRKVLENLEEAGLVDRVATSYQSKIVVSKGIIEAHFETYLKEISHACAGQK